MKTLLLLVLTLTRLTADSEVPPTTGVQVSLISELSQVAAGSRFKVGFKIHHEAGYHTYWQNPGIAGVPTRLAWQLPEGFTAGAIQWPHPERSSMAGYSIYGYERDAVLVAEIQAPAQLPAASVTLKVDGTWMACEKGCYPSRQQLELTLPVAAAAVSDPATAGVFTKAMAEIPGPLEAWSAELLTPKEAEEVKLILKPRHQPAQAMEKVYFFSADGQISSEHPQPVTLRSDGSYEIKLTRADASPEGKTSLPGVLEIPGTPENPKASFATIDPAYLVTP